MIFLQGFIKFDQGISEKCVGQTFDRRMKERKKEEGKNNNNNNKKRSKHNHGNVQNAKKLKNTKMIIAGYSPNRN
jgi:altronate dehydratase